MRTQKARAVIPSETYGDHAHCWYVKNDIYLRGGGYRGNQKSSERKKQSHEESHSSWDNLTKQAVMRNMLKFS